MDCGRPGEKVRMIQSLVPTARRVLNDAGTTPRSSIAAAARSRLGVLAARDSHITEVPARVLAQCPRACIPALLSLPQHILRSSFRFSVLDIS